MLFNSTAYLIFLPVVVGLFFALPHRLRWLLLLVASCVFYMAFVPVYILILAFTIMVDYVAGIVIEPARGRARRMFLVASIVANVGVLAIFKYYPFLTENLELLLGSIGIRHHFPDLGILLPIGLSFHTFQSLSYTLEVYHDRQPAERHFGRFALYVMFFPQLVAGPIERPQNLLPQFKARRSFSLEDLSWGLVKILYGLFKKVVVADRLAPFVDAVYADIPGSNGLTILLATLFFTVQIYCDFSGYSDIAIGSARIMGYRLMENFKRPYLSTSIREFWGRWHISLSSWFRDYLYIPLGGNRVVKWRWYYNLMITFLVSGLWHGASWTFIIWGALHGVYMVLGQLFRTHGPRTTATVVTDRLPRSRRVLQALLTFGLVALAWVFFRATSAPDAILALRKGMTLAGGLHVGNGTRETDAFHLLACFAAIALLALSYKLPMDLRVRHPRVLMVLTTLIIILFGRNGGEFIYFQF